MVAVVNWIMLYRAINLNIPKEVVRAARPSLTDYNRNYELMFHQEKQAGLVVKLEFGSGIVFKENKSTESEGCWLIDSDFYALLALIKHLQTSTPFCSTSRWRSYLPIVNINKTKLDRCSLFIDAQTRTQGKRSFQRGTKSFYQKSTIHTSTFLYFRNNYSKLGSFRWCAKSEMDYQSNTDPPPLIIRYYKKTHFE